MLKFPRFLLAIVLSIIIQSCAKDTDLISGFVVFDTAKTEYRSVKVSQDFEIEKSEKTVALIPFSD